MRQQAPGELRESADELEQAIDNWRRFREPGMLGEVLAFSVDPALTQQVIRLGYEALNTGAPATSVQSSLIHSLGKTQSIHELPPAAPNHETLIHPFQQPIQRLRALLRLAPDNPLALLDFAQLQTAVGKNTVAERALRSALALAPNNRVVIRTYARFLVHDRRPDDAHKLLGRHPRTQTDPWLMAAEIALADAAGKTGLLIGRGKRLLLDKSNWHPDHITELAGVVAMEELKSGNMKRAREAQRRALAAPNDNVVAQAVEFERAFGLSLDAPSVTRALANASEARLLHAWSVGEPDDVETHALGWHAEEPFSSRPIQLLTALYAYRGQFERAVRWAAAGLLTDPTDRGLLINLAYTHASAGNSTHAADAVRALRQLHHSTSEPFALATEGLVAYKQNNFDAGDALYDSATAMFERAKQPDVAAYCRVNQALSAIDANHPKAKEIAATASSALHKNPNQDSVMLLKAKAAAEFVTPTARIEPRRRTGQWVFDPKKNTLTEHQGITSIGAPAIVLSNSSKRH